MPKKKEIKKKGEYEFDYRCGKCHKPLEKDEKESSEYHSTWYCKCNPNVRLSVG